MNLYSLVLVFMVYIFFLNFKVNICFVLYFFKLKQLYLIIILFPNKFNEMGAILQFCSSRFH